MQSISCCHCSSEQLVKNGKAPNGKQKYQCKDCGKASRENPDYGYSEERKDEIIKAYQERSSMRYGFRYIFSRRSLLGLTLMFAAINLVSMLGVTVLSAMILARSGNDEVLLGGVRAALGLGGLASGVFISF